MATSSYIPNGTNNAAYVDRFGSTTASTMSGATLAGSITHTALTGTDLNNVSSDNSVYYNTGGSGSVSAIGVTAYLKINETPASITKISVTWVGYATQFGSALTTYFYIWDANSTTWTQLATSSGTSKFTLSADITTNIANYIDSNSNLYIVCVISAPISGVVSNHDYLNAVITYTPAAAGGAGFFMNFIHP